MLKHLALPYYRILIHLKNKIKPIQGIRLIEHHNIDVVFNMVQNKAKAHYNESVIKDIEVAMLPKRSKAVTNYLNAVHKRNISGGK